MDGRRRRAIGAEVTRDGVDVRVWAPDRRTVSVVLDGGHEVPLEQERGGYFRGLMPNARAGTRYRLKLDGEADAYPDPASRFQPDGPHGDSCIVDPSTYKWRDGGWRGPDIDRLVIYELHVGTFTREGTWRAAAAILPWLRELGINMIEVMPIGEFPGTFGWSYDGVDLWAPSHLYGSPDDLRAFIDTAHATDVSVILDVVYNHVGPDGCFLSQFSKNYFTKRYECEWGDALNFDGEQSAGVREFFVENAAYWIDEFHFDGLRLDATQSLFDASPEHIIKAVTRAAHEAGGDRRIFVVAENEPQDIALVERYGVDAMWNDDWHHAAMVAATGRREAYYTDYLGRPQEFISMAKFGFLYQGQRYSWQKNRRGTPSLGVAPRRLVAYLQNHDQVANSVRGDRIQQLTSAGRYRTLTALLLLGPNTPMLFQGQEFGASSPFLYFADHRKDLADAVAEGRHEFLRQFPSIAAITAPLRRPDDPRTFEASKLDASERDTHREAVALHRDLLRLRDSEAAFGGPFDGAVLSDEAFVIRFMSGGANDRLLIVNLGAELRLDTVPEPLLAPPQGQSWHLLWSSEAAEYGGAGTPPVEVEGRWDIPAESALLLSPSARIAEAHRE